MMPIPARDRPSYRRYRWLLLFNLVLIVPLGYAIRFAGNHWLNDSLGSVAYETFWVLLLALLWPRLALWRIALAVCLTTCTLEVLQLWQNPLYLAAKTTFVGRLVLGSAFYWGDFPAYLIGSCIAWFWAIALRRWSTGLVTPHA